MQLILKREDYLPHQFELLASDHPITALVSGFGAGKTYVFLRKCLLNLLFNKRDADGKSNGWVLYPTLELAVELFVDEFKKILEMLSIRYEYSIKSGRFKTSYGQIKIYTLDQPTRMVGANLTWVGIDEFDTVKTKKALDCYKKALGRLRGCKDPKLFIVTTPEGFKATYDIFIENAKDSQKIIHAKTKDNHFLPPSYIKLLQEQYDPKLLKAYLDGQFVNLTSGSVYYSFDREKHVLKENIPLESHLPINFCFDFNVYPYSVSWNQIINDEHIRFVDEWVSTMHSNTREACEAIIRKVPRNYDVVVYGDASGTSGAANSNTTNYQIINDVFTNYFKSVRYKVPKANPAVKDRINCVNNKVYKNHVTFNPACIKLIQDFEQVIWNEKGTELDKTNQLRTHSSDGAGYFFYAEYPIQDFRRDLKTRSY